MFIVVFVVIWFWIFFIPYTQEKRESRIQKACEYAYAEGQKDALEGKWVIKYDSTNHVWCWINSPWDNGRKPVYELNKDIIKQLNE